MLTSEPVTIREGTVCLTLRGENAGVVHVSCEGAVVLPDYRPEDDPLARLLGPGVYGRKVLLGMERVSFLDTSGVSWLVSSHERFLKAGGTLLFHSVPPQARLVLQLLHLDQVLRSAPDGAAGQARLEGKGS
jgi:hypothetical protein